MFTAIRIRERTSPVDGSFSTNAVDLTTYVENVDISYDETLNIAEVTLRLSTRADVTLINRIMAGCRVRNWQAYPVYQMLEFVSGSKTWRSNILSAALNTYITAQKEYAPELKLTCEAPFIRYDTVYTGQTISTDGTNMPYGAVTPRVAGLGSSTFTWVIFPVADAITNHVVTTESTGASGTTTRTFNIPFAPGKSFVLLLALSGSGTTATITVNNYVTRQIELYHSSGYITAEVFRLTPTSHLTSNTFTITWSTNPSLSSFKIIGAFCFEARDYLACSINNTEGYSSFDIDFVNSFWRGAVTAGGGKIFKPKHTMAQFVLPSISGLQYQWRYAEYL